MTEDNGPDAMHKAAQRVVDGWIREARENKAVAHRYPGTEEAAVAIAKSDLLCRCADEFNAFRRSWLVW